MKTPFTRRQQGSYDEQSTKHHPHAPHRAVSPGVWRFFILLALGVVSTFIKPLGPLASMEYGGLAMSLIPISVFMNARFAEKVPMNTTQEPTPVLYRILRVLLVGSVFVLFLLSILVSALRSLRAIGYFLGAIC
ncbi:hypothetical protein [Reticulibacter mediterranei]|nr:hypothetical protein [Reticulibacter mediterranei]